MAADMLTTTDELVTSLNNATFTAPYADITAVRDYDPEFTLEEMETLRVSVIPPQWKTQVATRGQSENDYAITIGVQKRVTGDTEAARDSACDDLVHLVEEIADHCLDLVLSGGAQAIRCDIAPLYDPEQLKQLRVFTSVITVTLRQMRSL